VNTFTVALITGCLSFLVGVVIENIFSPVQKIRKFIAGTGEKISDIGDKIAEIDDNDTDEEK
jgi:hypothetical protein